MRNIWTIARREYKLYFVSPVAYVVAFLFLVVLGFFFFQEVTRAVAYSVYYNTAPGAEVIISPMVTLILFTMPALTMRLIAEEQRTGTMELILTAPVRDWELVVGKWLGCFLFALTLVAITFIYPIVLNMMVDPGIDQGVVFAGYLGLILMVGSLLAMGVAVSALFSNQVAAFFVSLALVLAVWIIRPAASAMGAGSEILSYLNFVDHYLTFFRGTIDLSDVTYYLSLTTLGLVLGTVFVEIRRWR